MNLDEYEFAEQAEFLINHRECNKMAKPAPVKSFDSSSMHFDELSLMTRSWDLGDFKPIQLI